MIALAIFFLTFLPGAVLAAFLPLKKISLLAWLPIAGSLGVAWTTAGSLIFALFKLSIGWPSVGLWSLLPLLAVLIFEPFRKLTRKNIARITYNPLALILPLLLIILLAGSLLGYEGLPTGDIQKSIYWGEQVLEGGGFPSYQQAEELNRDPADFFTPALHTLTAVILSLTETPLKASAWFAFTASIILAGLAASLTFLITPSVKAGTLVFIFASLNFRFLRYASAPGYHFQNLIGEILLWSALFLLLASLTKNITRNGRIFSASAAILLLALIPLTHQFTAFLTLLLFPVLLLAVLIYYRKKILLSWQGLSIAVKQKLYAGSAAVIFLTVIALYFSPLPEKLGHLFNTEPHLLSILIPLTEYPKLLGASFFFLGIGGIIVIPFLIKNSKQIVAMLVLSVWTLAIFILGQGPKYFLDIPSARTIFLAIIPLAVFSGLLIYFALNKVIQFKNGSKYILAFLIVIFGFSPLIATALKTFNSIDLDSRVNTTVTPEINELLEFLVSYHKKNTASGAQNILVDDWNARKLTWTILSPYSMKTRLGGNLDRAAAEASQSPLRKKLYQNHLDYEKMFMAGNSKLIAPLLDKHQINLIGTSKGTSADVFTHNPLLEEVYESERIKIYRYQKERGLESGDPRNEFLLSDATLVNDVGDSEDVLPHSAISLQSVKISPPQLIKKVTVRENLRKQLTLKINAKTYSAPLWDKNGDRLIEQPLTLLVRGQDNGALARVKADDNTIGKLDFTGHDDFKDAILTIPANKLQINKKGFINLQIESENAPLVLDLVAVGIMAK